MRHLNNKTNFYFLPGYLYRCKIAEQLNKHFLFFVSVNNHELVSKSLSFHCLNLTLVRHTNMTTNIFLVPLSSNST
jgi:hypothetical protein